VWGEDIYATFNVEANQSANLAFSTSGIVDKVYVDIGDSVKKGQVLASLKVGDLKAELKVLEVELKYAQKDWQRAQKAKRVMDKVRLDQYAFKRDIALAKIKLQKELIDKSILKAPFDGVIFGRDIEVGDVVTGMNPKTVLQIESQRERKLLIYIDQKYVKVVKKGDLFRYRFSDDNTTKRVKITKIYPTIDTKSRKMTAQAQSQDEMVGLFGDGYIEAKE
jgi:RND family efflux transporter MFP subunit